MDEFTSPPPINGRSGITLSDLLGRFDEVETEANGYVVPCPAHSDSHPSLRVGYNADTKKVMLKCRSGCKTTAVLTAMDLSMADLFDVEAGDLADIRSAGSVPEKPSVGDRAALKMYLDRAHSALADSPAFEYAERRFGVNAAKAADLGLGYDDGTVNGGNLVLSRAKYHDAPRLVVPFNDFDGHPHSMQARALHNEGVQARWCGPNNPEGAAWGKYGYLEGGTGWTEVIITEGPGDGLTSAAVGYDTVLIRGAALGTNTALADEITDALKGRRVVVAGDTDGAGQTFTRDIASAMSERGIDVYRLIIPLDGVSDITEWRERAGSAFTAAFIRAVKEAQRYGNDQIVAEEIQQEITRLFSDVYNAKALLGTIQEQGADVRFTIAAGFIVYRPEVGVWRVDEAEWVRSQAQDVAHRIQRAVLAQMQVMDARIATITDPAARDAIGKVLDAQRKKARSGGLVSYVMSTRGIDSMIRELRALPGVFADFEDFDQHPHLLAVANGVVNLEDGTLRPYGPDVKNLYLMRRIDVAYDPEARNPRWERFISEIFSHFPNDEDGAHRGLPAFMQRLVGYGITGHTTEQSLAVFYGGGSNGKGVLIETLTGIFKGITFTTPFATFENKPSGGIPTDIAAMKGARFVMASEGEQGKHMAEALLKRLTGGDTMTARFLYQREFSYVPTFLIILATNYKPNFRGQDYGLWRRVKLVPFTRKFTSADRDTHLVSKFLGRRVPTSAYLPEDDFGDGPEGILTWAVQGAVQWASVGLAPPAVISEATDEFKETSDSLKEFYDEHLVKDPAGRISGKDVWALYQEWCEAENLPVKDRWKRSTFWKALEERQAVKIRSGGVSSFKGIRRRKPSEHGADQYEQERADDSHSTDTGDTEVTVPGDEDFMS